MSVPHRDCALPSVLPTPYGDANSSVWTTIPFVYRRSIKRSITPFRVERLPSAPPTATITTTERY